MVHFISFDITTTIALPTPLRLIIVVHWAHIAKWASF